MISSKDFANGDSFCSQIDRGCARPWEKRTGVDDGRLFNGPNSWFVSVADDQKFRVFPVLVGHVHGHLRGCFPAIEYFEDTRWRPGLSKENLQLAPDSWIVVFQARVFFDASVFDGLKEVVETDIAFALEVIESLFRYVAEKLRILTPWGDILENPVAMSDEDIAAV